MKRQPFHELNIKSVERMASSKVIRGGAKSYGSASSRLRAPLGILIVVALLVLLLGIGRPRVEGKYGWSFWGREL